MFVCIYQAQHRDAFVQERYGQYDLSDPFLALQRDSESEERQNMLTEPHTHLQGRGVSPNPLAVLKLVMAHCKRMQERMMGQLAAAERRHKRVRSNAHSYKAMNTTCFYIFSEFSCSPSVDLHVAIMLQPPWDSASIRQEQTLSHRLVLFVCEYRRVTTDLHISAGRLVIKTQAIGQLLSKL